MRRLIALALLLPVAAQAATVTVNWVNPTQNEDNSAIPATGPGSLSRWRIEYGTCGAGNTFGTKVGEVTRDRGTGAALTSATLNLNPGTSCVRAYVGNTYSVESDASNVTTSVVDPPKPKPVQLTTSSVTAYELRTDADGAVRVARVGLVPLGAVCGAEQVQAAGETYTRIDSRLVDFVNWPARVAPDVFAVCG